MKFPTNIFVLLVDDVREEKSGKLSLNGVFVGDDIVFPANTQTPLLLPQVCFFLRFTDGDGSWMFDWVLTHQNGSEIAKNGEPFQISKLADTVHILVLRVSPLAIPVFGKFTLHMTLDDHTYDYEFEAKVAD